MKAEAPVHPVLQRPRVRRASLQDGETLVRLSQQLGYPSSIQQIETQLHTMHGSEDHAILVVELAGGRVAGWVHIFERPLVFRPGGAELVGLIVEEAERGQAFGRLLLQAAEEWARKHDLEFIMLRSNTKRLGAREFYTASGYELVKTSNTFRKALKDSP